MRSLISIIAFLTIVACKKTGMPPAENEPPARLAINGQTIKTPDGNAIELRGLNWGWWGTAQPQDAAEAINMGANVVRMPFRWYFGGKKIT